MNYTGSIDLLIAVRDLLEEKVGDIPMYDLMLPTHTSPSELPDSFVLIQPIVQYYHGDVDSYGTVEICLYARNTLPDIDQPDIPAIKELTDIVYPALQNAVKNNTAILDIRDKIVNHPEIRYHYNSLICETISINN